MALCIKISFDVVSVGQIFELQSVTAVVVQLLGNGRMSWIAVLKVCKVHPWLAKIPGRTVEGSAAKWAYF